MAQRDQLLEQMTRLQEQMGNKEVFGESGTGVVKVVMNCKGDLKAIKIAKELLVQDEVEILEDLIVAAFNDAKSKIEVALGSILSKSALGI